MLYTALTTTLSVTRIEAAASRNCHCTKAAKIYSCQQPPLLMLSKLRSISIDGSVIDYFKKDITDDETFLVKDCVASDQRPQVYNGSTSVSL
ncbi:hypothetical protein T4B_950 [Trichinella pseudospiralis]|uniref:Uncharacterized protein n=1 Tax=Trichinella pseudospiralis TaxID=6337 RepID=A0A0V1IX73_TRIPS|nr:hypothetical protein T4B_950 [Trichinella pseudospiralis]